MRLSALAFAAAVAALPAAAETPSRSLSKTLPLAAGERVKVDTYKGSVKVTTWDKAEVAVEAKVVADPECGSTRQQEKWVEETKIAIGKDSSGVSIVSDYDDFEDATSWFHTCTARPFVHYVVRMPRTAALKIKDYKSVLSVTGLSAGLKVETYKGKLDVEGLEGPFTVDTYKGTVHAALTRLAGDVRGETYKGQIVLSLPSNAAFQLDADAGRRGDFSSDFPTTTSTHASRRRSLEVRGDVNGGGPHVTLKTDKGSLSLRKG